MDDPSSSRRFFTNRSAVWNASDNRECRPAEPIAATFVLSLRISADLPASHAAARELSYPAATQGRSWIMLN